MWKNIDFEIFTFQETFLHYVCCRYIQYAEDKMAAQFYPEYLNTYEHYRPKMGASTICKVLESQICQKF